eukprot:CFRG7348T1
MFTTPTDLTESARRHARVRPIVELTTPSGTPLKRKAQKHLRFHDDSFKTPNKFTSLCTQTADLTLFELQAQLSEKQKELEILKDLIHEKQGEMHAGALSTPVNYFSATSAKESVVVLSEKMSGINLKTTGLDSEATLDMADDQVLSVYYDHNDANYDLIEEVGKGTFGTCHLVEHKRTGERLCRKQIDLCFKDVDMEDVRNEATFLFRIKHPNCLQLFDLHINPNMELSIYMEYCPWSLESLRLVRHPRGATRERLDAITVVNTVYQSLHGLHYLKNFGKEEAKTRALIGSSSNGDETLTICHCDIKSDNLMINFEGCVKICDFGLAVLLKNNEHITDEVERGSEAYMAPEVAVTKEYWEACDVYSLGVSAYEMLTGRLPKGRGKPKFWEKTRSMLMMVTEDDDSLCTELLHLLKAMMDPDPLTRAPPDVLLSDKFTIFGGITMESSQIEMLEALRKGESLHKTWLEWKQELNAKGAEKDLDFTDNDSSTASESEKDAEESDDTLDDE